MAGTGFPQRFKGRVAIGQLWLGMPSNAAKLTASAADLNATLGMATVTVTPSSTATIPNNGSALILSSSLAIYSIADPTPGVDLVLQILPGSSAVYFKVSTGLVTIIGSTLYGGSTIANVISSTSSLIATAITLRGISTSQYVLASILPSTLSHVKLTTTT